MKVCPVCKSRCFDDMDICYGCMHKFKNRETRNNLSGFDKTIAMKKIDYLDIPEYFEIDSFPIIEEIEHNHRDELDMVETISSNDCITLKIPIEVVKKYIV